jgi:hypothetical protein
MAGGGAIATRVCYTERSVHSPGSENLQASAERKPHVARDGLENRHPLGKASAAHLEDIRSVVRALAEEAGLRNIEEFAHAWHIVLKGSIVVAAEGDRDAAQRAKSIARFVIRQHRATPVASGHRLA